MNICLIGNNLTSLLLAKALINKKIKVTMYYKNKYHIGDNTRTIGISSNNTEFIQREIIKVNKSLLWSINQIEIYSKYKENNKILNFSEPKKNLFYIIKNDELYQLLYQSLEKNSYFKKVIIKNLKVYDKIIENSYYDLIINCDSKNKISKKYFSKKIYKDYKSTAYTSVINHEKIKNKKAVQVFTKYGPIAFLPISENKTSVVCSIKNDKKKKRLTEDEYKKFILSHNIDYKIKNITKFSNFKLEFKVSKEYFFNKILAFGEVLHHIHPLAGQGFNMTIRDIKILLEIIRNKKSLGLQFDEIINEDFEARAKHLNFIFSSGIDFIHEFFVFDNRHLKYYSNIILKKLNKNKLLNKIFINFADKGIGG
ncbi:FAD-dependent monooxygenase [Candidatus Pelagibacter sp.]|nr:FAD-dependent monooxygenase [Candidatus Pelagibacter sp.]